MYFWLGFCLSLTVLLLLNVLASLITATLWRVITPHAQEWAAQDRARMLFALRLAPILAALVFVVTLVLPAYLKHEPPQTGETLSWPLAGLAALSFLGLALAAWRGVAAWRATRRMMQDWLQRATPVTLPGIDVPAFRLRHPFPVVAVVGLWRVRLFVAEQLFASLTEAEMAATLQHELGHLAAHDNLKRTILRACSDVLTIVPCGRGLDRAWADCAESAADEHAVQSEPKISLNLASALLKIARLAPPGTHPALPLGAFMFNAADGSATVTQRVRHLVRLADKKPRPHHRRLDLAVWSGLGSFVILLLLAAWHTSATTTIYHFLEHIVAATS